MVAYKAGGSVKKKTGPKVKKRKKEESDEEEEDDNVDEDDDDDDKDEDEKGDGVLWLTISCKLVIRFYGTPNWHKLN